MFHELQTPSVRDRDRIEREIVVDLAGGIAEKIHRCRADHVRGRFDMRNACDRASVLGFDDPEQIVVSAYLTWMTVRTKAMLKTPLLWGQVEAVAKALLARRKPTATEVRAIIDAERNALLKRAQSEFLAESHYVSPPFSGEVATAK